MRSGLLKIESFRKGIILSSGFNFVAKILQFFQGLVIAYYFGTQSSSDVYFYCLATVTLLSVFVNSLDSAVLVPEAIRIREHDGNDRSMQFLNVFLYLYAAAGIFTCLVLLVFPVKIFLLISNFDEGVLQQNRDILLLFIPLFTLMIITNLVVNILTSYRFFTIPMIVSVINGVFVIAFLFLFQEEMDIMSAVIGQIVAYCLNLFFLIWLLRSNLKWQFAFAPNLISRKVISNILFAQAGNVTTVLASYMPMYFLSGFATGIVTSFTFGQKTADIPNQIITNQSSNVFGIKLNELFAKGNFDDVNRVFITTANFLVFVLVPISVLMFVFSKTVMIILYDRGEFNQQAVETSTQFFKYFVLLLPMLAINTLVSRLFIAGQRIKQAFAYQVIFNIALFIAIVIGIKLGGPVGYVYSLLVLHVINVCGCYFLLNFFFPFVRYTRFLHYFFFVIIGNIPVFFVLEFVQEKGSDANKWILFLGSSAFYVLLLTVASRLFKINNEVNVIANRIFDFLKPHGKNTSRR